MDRSFELLEKLTVVQWLLQRRRRRLRADAGPVVDASCGQGRILAMLKLKDDISTKDLSHVLGIRVSSLNEMLAKLEKGGYVERHPSEEDKRVMLVTLTQKGRDADQVEAAPSAVFSCLSDEEQEQMAAYLDRLIAALEESMGEDGRDSLDRARRRREEMFSFMRGNAEGAAGRAARDFPFGFGGPRGPRDRDHGGRRGCGDVDGRA